MRANVCVSRANSPRRPTIRPQNPGFGLGGARPPRATFPADLKHGNPSRSRTLSPMVGVRLTHTAGPFKSYAGNSSAVHSD